MKEESGMVSLGALLVLLFVSAVVIGAGLFIRTAVGPIFSYSEKTKEKTQMQEILEEVLSAMQNDQTPQADSLFDAWHNSIESIASENSCEIIVTPVSDAINPNFATQEFLSSDYISAALKTNANQMANIKQYRADNFISIDLQTHYKAFFPEDVLSNDNLLNYLSPYGYININNCDISVADILLTRWADAGCREYLNNLRATEEIETSTKAALQKLRIDDAGILTTASQYNINFMPKDQLLGVLEYIAGFENKERAITNPKGIHQLIVNGRDNGEITPEQLQKLLAVPKQPHPVFSYLGTITWFWKVTIQRDTLKLDSIVCKIPAEENPMYGDITMNSQFFQTVPVSANAPLDYETNGEDSNFLQIVSVRYTYE